jgi:hypothetical protein
MNNLTSAMPASVLRNNLLRLAGRPGFNGTDAVHTHMTNTR